MKRIYALLLAFSILMIWLAKPVFGTEAEAQAVEILRIQSEGEAVVNLQMRLRDLGYFNYKVTGYYGTVTAAAVRTFQEKNGLRADGTVGPQTSEILYSNRAKRLTVTQNNTGIVLPASRGGVSSFGQMLDWFAQVQYIFPRGATAKVTDINTGISFNIRRTGGTNHADVEPLSIQDSNNIRRIWGGWSWNRRAVIVEIGGIRVAGSMHGMPHAYNTISGNGMQGHVCIHFYRSRTHVHNRQDPDHQAMVRRAAGR